MNKQNIINILTIWLANNHPKSLDGKVFFTRFDVCKNIADSTKTNYQMVEKTISKNKKINDELNDWLNNNFWHVMISLKIPKGIELYIESELKLKRQKFVPDFLDDIPSPKVKVAKFTMNNDIEGVENYVNENDKIMNLGQLEDFDELDIPFEEVGPEYD